MPWPYTACNDYIITTRPLNHRLCFYLHYCKPPNIEIGQDGRPASTDLTLLVINEVIKTSSRYWSLWLYLYFYELYNNQSWDEGTWAYTDFILRIW